MWGEREKEERLFGENVYVNKNIMGKRIGRYLYYVKT